MSSVQKEERGEAHLCTTAVSDPSPTTAAAERPMLLVMNPDITSPLPFADVLNVDDDDKLDGSDDEDDQSVVAPKAGAAKLSQRQFKDLVKTMKVGYSLSHVPEDEWPQGLPLSAEVDRVAVHETSTAIAGMTKQEADQHRMAQDFKDLQDGKLDAEGMIDVQDAPYLQQKLIDQGLEMQAPSFRVEDPCDVDWTAKSVIGSVGESTRFNPSIMEDFEMQRTTTLNKEDQGQVNKELFGEDCDTQPLPYIANGSQDPCNVRCRFFANLSDEEKAVSSPKAVGLLSLSEMYMIELRYQKTVIHTDWSEDEQGFTKGVVVDQAMQNVASLIKQMCSSDEQVIRDCKLKRAYSGNEKCLMMARKWSRVHHGAHLMRENGITIVPDPKDGHPKFAECPKKVGKALNTHKYGTNRHCSREAVSNDIRLLHVLYQNGYIDAKDVSVALSDMVVYSQWISEREKKCIVGAHVMMLKSEQFGLHVPNPKDFENWCRNTYLNYASQVFGSIIFGKTVSTKNTHEVHSRKWMNTEIKGALDRVLFNVTDCLIHTRAAYMWKQNPHYAVLQPDGTRVDYDPKLSRDDQPGIVIPVLVLPVELSSGKMVLTWLETGAFEKKLRSWREVYTGGGASQVNVQSVILDSKFNSKGRLDDALRKFGVKNAGEIAAITRQLDNDGKRVSEAITIQYHQATLLPARSAGLTDAEYDVLLKECGARQPQMCVSRATWCFKTQGHLDADAHGFINGLVHQDNFHWLTTDASGRYVRPTLYEERYTLHKPNFCTTLMRKNREIMDDATAHEAIPMGARAARLDAVNREQLLGDRAPIKGFITMRGFQSEHPESQSLEAMLYAQLQQSKMDAAAIREHSLNIVNYFFQNNFDGADNIGMRYAPRDRAMRRATELIDDEDDEEELAAWIADASEVYECLDAINAEYQSWFANQDQEYVASEFIIDCFGRILEFIHHMRHRSRSFEMEHTKYDMYNRECLSPSHYFSELKQPFVNAQTRRDGPRPDVPNALKSANLRVLAIQDTPHQHPPGSMLDRIINGRFKAVCDLHTAHVQSCEALGHEPKEFEEFVAITRNLDKESTSEMRLQTYVQHVKESLDVEEKKLEAMQIGIAAARSKADSIANKTSNAYIFAMQALDKRHLAFETASRSLETYKRHLLDFELPSSAPESSNSSKKRKNPIEDEWVATEAKRRLTEAQQAALSRLQRRGKDAGVFTSGDNVLNKMIQNINETTSQTFFSDEQVKSRAYAQAAQAVGISDEIGGDAEMGDEEGEDYDGDPATEEAADQVERRRVAAIETSSMEVTNPSDDEDADAANNQSDDLSSQLNIQSIELPASVVAELQDQLAAPGNKTSWEELVKAKKLELYAQKLEMQAKAQNRLEKEAAARADAKASKKKQELAKSAQIRKRFPNQNLQRVIMGGALAGSEEEDELLL